MAHSVAVVTWKQLDRREKPDFSIADAWHFGKNWLTDRSLTRGSHRTSKLEASLTGETDRQY